MAPRVSSLYASTRADNGCWRCSNRADSLLDHATTIMSIIINSNGCPGSYFSICSVGTTFGKSIYFTLQKKTMRADKRIPFNRASSHVIVKCISRHAENALCLLWSVIEFRNLFIKICQYLLLANPPAFGIATVPAHAVEAGSQGNIATGVIYQQDGSSLTIKNLTAFAGGQDAPTTHYVQDADRADAIAAAKASVEAKKPTAGLLVRPCTEAVKQSETRVTVQVVCQYAIYRAPTNTQVLSVLQVQGSSIVLRIRKVVLPQ